MGLKKIGFYGVILSAFTGTAFLAVSLGPIHIFPFRVMIFALWILLFLKNGTININHIRVRNYFRFLIFWLVYGLTSTLWAADKIEAIKHVIFLALGISTIFFIVFSLRSIRDLNNIYWLWISIFSALLPIGFWEVATGNHLPGSGLNDVDEGYEFYKFAPTTVFSNQNDYSTYIALTLPMLMVGIRYMESNLKRLILAFLYCCGIMLLLFSTSRANYIAVLLGGFFWVLFILRFPQRLKLFGLIACIMSIIVLNLSVENYEYLGEVWKDFNVLLDSTEDDAGLDVRGNLIKNALYFFIISFGFGVGAGNVEYYMDNFPKYPVGEIGNVHNWWLEILANYGILIFIGYCIFYISCFYQLWINYKKLKAPEERMICEALLCAMVGFPVSSISSSSLMAFNPQWLFFGIVLAFINFKRNHHKIIN